MRYNNLGADVLLNYLSRIRPDVLVTLADIWWLTYISEPVITNFLRTAGIPWVLYFPIGGDMGQGRIPSSWVHILKTVDLPIAMSQYGVETVRANGCEPAYIPHGVESSVFYPPVNKKKAKSKLGYEGKFVILSDARNQPRKMIPRALEVFRRFAENKDDTLLHLHCDPDDPVAKAPDYNYNLRSDIAFLQLSDKVRTTDGMSIARGISLRELSKIYQAADVHLLTSWGEGFGLPSLQAASAGVIPLASDHAASRELVQGHGEAIRVKDYLPGQFGLKQALIDINDAVDRLERLYRDRDLVRHKAEASRRFAEQYDWNKVVQQWHDLLSLKVPQLSLRKSVPATASRVLIGPGSAQGSVALRRMVGAALPKIPDGALISLSVVEEKAGRLIAEVYRDAQESSQSLTIPVSLPPVDRDLTKQRIPGCVYVASILDIHVLEILVQVFPGISVWSDKPVALIKQGPKGNPLTVKVVPIATKSFARYLAASTLALDLEGSNPDIPVHAAQLGVPCIGLSTQPAQAWLWPELSLGWTDMQAAAWLGRWLMTDQGDAARACAQAHQRLMDASQASN
jgi:glycosyltransferase involved in cell wall biosynthesis